VATDSWVALGEPPEAAFLDPADVSNCAEAWLREQIRFFEV
jgi:hypothetical protein